MHIYPLSRLVHAQPVGWEDLLNSIEEGKEYAFGWYQPLREAVVSYCQAKGAGRDTIVRIMRSRALSMWGSRGPEVAKANEDAFDKFETLFYPRIRRFQRNLLRDAQKSVNFEGLQLTGAPHFQVIDENDKERYVFLLAAKWKTKDLKAYLELLSIIVQQRFRKPSQTIWCMDLRTGKDFKWSGSSKRMRAKCAKAARLYRRFERTAEVD
ncbi:MAG: hypothetical protein LAN62_02520 [Acidobacteriia bacterium]|nr:hypothetical protein [Terriglobia bacterium]